MRQAEKTSSRTAVRALVLTLQQADHLLRRVDQGQVRPGRQSRPEIGEVGTAQQQGLRSAGGKPAGQLRQAVARHQLLRGESRLYRLHHGQHADTPQLQGRIGLQQHPLDAGEALGVGGDHRQGTVPGCQLPVHIQRRHDPHAGLSRQRREIHGAGQGVAVHKGPPAAPGAGVLQDLPDVALLLRRRGVLESGLFPGVRRKAGRPAPTGPGLPGSPPPSGYPPGSRPARRWVGHDSSSFSIVLHSSFRGKLPKTRTPSCTVRKAWGSTEWTMCSSSSISYLDRHTHSTWTLSLV